MFDLLLAAALAQPAPAVPAGNWELILDVPVAQYFIDRSTLVRDGNQRTIVARIVDRRPQAAAAGMGSAVMRMRFDCTASTSVILHMKLYNQQGALLHEADTTEAQRAPIAIADEQGRTALAAICGS